MQCTLYNQSWVELNRLWLYSVYVGVQLMRELEKVVRPNVVHFSVIDPTTTLGTPIRYVLLLLYTGWPQNGTIFLYALSSSNINRLSKFFHCQNQEKICNNSITKDPTTPQVCRYTTL